VTPLHTETAHVDLVREALGGRLTEEDALLWMVLLHTHQIHIRANFVDEAWRRHERNRIVTLSAHTQRGVAAVIAELWREIRQKRTRPPEEPRTRYEHWYWEFNTRVPYEVVESIPAELLPRLQELRNQLAHDPRVVDIVPDD
jgi:hypothetical protein